MRDEVHFEDTKIDPILSKNGWKKLNPKYNTDSKLRLNWKHIIEKNNYHTLLKHKSKKINPRTNQPYGAKLTQNEMNYIYKVMCENCTDNYSKLKWLKGYSGVLTIRAIEHANCKLILYVSSNMEQIVKKSHPDYHTYFQYSDQQRRNNGQERFDVTLLINGLPNTQIELKYSYNPLIGLGKLHHHKHSAFYQMQNYQQVNAYNGMFSTLQMMVIANQKEVYYFPKPDSIDQYSENIARKWQKPGSVIYKARSEHKNVHKDADTNYFFNHVLKPHTLYELTSKYHALITNSQKHGTILPYSYQYYGCNQMLDFANQHKSSYIDQSTGAGKTYIASEVAIQEALKGNIVIMLTDRTDLRENYANTVQSMVNNEGILKVQDAPSARQLESILVNLKNNNHTIFVTTIQALSHIRDERKLNHFAKTVYFIIDEIQRSNMGNMQEILRSYFSNSIWSGFTGTPILQSHPVIWYRKPYYTLEFFKHHCADADYSMADALADKRTVPLKFFNMQTTTNKDVINCIVQNYKNKHPKQTEQDYQNFKNKINKAWKQKYSERPTLEKKYNSIFYPSNTIPKQHIQAVVRNVIKKWENHSYIKGTPYFKGLLIANSIPEAFYYYKCFKKYTKIYKEKGIYQSDEEHQQRRLPNFTMMVSTIGSDSDEASESSTKNYGEVINDYNKKYNTDCASINEYENNVRSKLQQTGSQSSKQSLDICIVVNKLCTGFDAKQLKLMFLDKTIQSYAGIVQTLSRINRNCAGKSVGLVFVYRNASWQWNIAQHAYNLYGTIGNNTKSTNPIIQHLDYPKVRDDTEQKVTNLKHFTDKYANQDVVSKHHKKVYMQKYAKAMNAINAWNSLINIGSPYTDNLRDKKMLSNQKQLINHYKDLMQKNYETRFYEFADALNQSKEEAYKTFKEPILKQSTFVTRSKIHLINYQLLTHYVNTKEPLNDYDMKSAIKNAFILANIKQDKLISKHFKHILQQNHKHHFLSNHKMDILKSCADYSIKSQMAKQFLKSIDSYYKNWLIQTVYSMTKNDSMSHIQHLFNNYYQQGTPTIVLNLNKLKDGFNNYEPCIKLYKKYYYSNDIDNKVLA